MNTTRAAVIAAVAAAFPQRSADDILAVLDAYGAEPYERERERVQLAIVQLCAGDVTKLAPFVAAAKTDYRDVLLWAERGPLTAAAGAAAQEAARQLIRNWGTEEPDDK